MITLLSDQELRVKMGQKARHRMEAYFWKDAAQKTLKVYQEAVQA